MKESLRQVAALLPKLKPDLVVSIRKLELTVFKLCQTRAYHSAVTHLL